MNRDVEKLLGAKLSQLRELVDDSPLGADQLDLGEFEQLINDDAPIKNVAAAGKDLIDGLDALKPNAGDAGFDQWAEDVKDGIQNAVLVAGVGEMIADALGDGGPAGGPMGPGDLAPGGNGPDPDPGGPGDLAPGGDGPDPPGPGDGGPGGLLPPPGGGGGGGGGGGDVDIDIDINLDFWFGDCGWFGHGCFPIIHCPYYPAHHCCWIGEQILVCGTGGVGYFEVMYGSPAAIGLPLPIVDPVPALEQDVSYAGRILVMNPVESGGLVGYLLNDQPFQMEAGMMQEINRDYVTIQFSRGPGLSQARYSLVPATYKFVVTEKGWDLVKTRFHAMLDNTAHDADFQLMLENELVTVPARSSVEVKSDYPIVVAFNDGGVSPVQKRLTKGATYTIGIDKQTGRWDLFPGNAQDSGAGQIGDVQMIAQAGSIAAPKPIVQNP